MVFLEFKNKEGIAKGGTDKFETTGAGKFILSHPAEVVVLFFKYKQVKCDKMTVILQNGDQSLRIHTRQCPCLTLIGFKGILLVSGKEKEGVGSKGGGGKHMGNHDGQLESAVNAIRVRC